jgi:hypothetical protein
VIFEKPLDIKSSVIVNYNTSTTDSATPLSLGPS